MPVGCTYQFIIDGFSRYIVGGVASRSLRSDLAIDALGWQSTTGRADSLEGLKRSLGRARRLQGAAPVAVVPRRSSSRWRGMNGFSSLGNVKARMLYHVRPAILGVPPAVAGLLMGSVLGSLV